MTVPVLLLMVFGLLFLFSCGEDKQDAVSSETQMRSEFVKAFQLMREKDYETARQVVEDVIIRDQEKKDAEAMYVMGLIYLKMERRGDALKMANRALETDPEFAGAYSILAETDYLVSHFDGAVANARKALQLDPNQALAYKVIGEIYIRQGKTADSIHVLENAQSLAPDDTEILTKLASAYIKASEHRKALKVLEDAGKIDPKIPGVHFNLAMVYSELKDGGKALFHINEAEKLYAEEGNKRWTAKARSTKRVLAKEFKMRPEDIDH